MLNMVQIKLIGISAVPFAFQSLSRFIGGFGYRRHVLPSALDTSQFVAGETWGIIALV